MSDALSKELPSDILATLNTKKAEEQEKRQSVDAKVTQEFLDSNSSLFSIELNESTELNQIKQQLENAISTAKEFYESVKTTDRLINEKDSTTLERAIDYLKGNRKTSDSLLEAVRILAGHEVIQAKIDFDNDFNSLWNRESRHQGPISMEVGSIVHGQYRMVRDFGGSELLDRMVNRLENADRIYEFVKSETSADASVGYTPKL